MRSARELYSAHDAPAMAGAVDSGFVDWSALQARLPGLEPNVSLAGRSSWRVGGAAEWWFEPRSVEALAELFAELPTSVPRTVLGLGSNVLIRDGGVPGLVVSLRRLNARAVLEDGRRQDRRHGRLRLEAGLPCAQAARFAARHGLAGLEFFAGIPGTVGGALAMNAGAWGGETWPLVESVEGVTADGRRFAAPAEAFDYGYRRVAVRRRCAVASGWSGGELPDVDEIVWTAVTLRLESADAERRADIEARMRTLLRERAERQPQGQPSCGSVFRNPDGDHAGRLIEAAGLKGRRRGGAWVSEKHANFIVHDGTATAADIEGLIEEVRETVQRRSGVRLETEVRILGRALDRPGVDSPRAAGGMLDAARPRGASAVTTAQAPAPAARLTERQDRLAALGRVVVLMGGVSGEREVSLASGRAVATALARSGIDAVAVDWDGRSSPAAAVRAAVGADATVFLVLHGGAGEDGTVQACLELAGIRYTGSGVAASAVGMDKLLCKRLWAGAGLPVVPYRVAPVETLLALAPADEGDRDRSAATLERWLADLRGEPPSGDGGRLAEVWPVVVKPAAAGSSLGVHRVENAAQWRAAVADAARHPGAVLVERCIQGREFTVGIVGEQVLPPVEIVVEGGFYDYDAKYVSDRTRYLCPAPLDADETRHVTDLARRAFDTVGAAGWGRIDFLRDANGRWYLLEINTAPGMTDHSLVPKAAQAIGWDFSRLCVEILLASPSAAAARSWSESDAERAPVDGGDADARGDRVDRDASGGEASR